MGLLQEYGVLGPLLPPGPCITKVRAVHVCDITLSMFSVGVGLLKGCSLSIILCLIFMDRISK